MKNKVEILRAACCIAGLDGGVCQDELNLLRRLAADIGVGQASLDAMINRAESDRDFYQELFRYLSSEPDETLKILFRIAIADRDLNTNESVVLHDFAKRLGVSDERYDELLRAADQKLDG